MAIKVGYVVATGFTSLTTGTSSTDQVSGTFQYAGPGTYQLVAKASATGMYATMLVGGQVVCQDKIIPFYGTAGTLSTSDNVVAGQTILNNGKTELYFRNPTGGTVTVDWIIWWDPLGPDFLRRFTRKLF